MMSTVLHWLLTGWHPVIVVYCLLLSTITVLALWKDHHGPS